MEWKRLRAESRRGAILTIAAMVFLVLLFQFSITTCLSIGNGEIAQAIRGWFSLRNGRGGTYLNFDAVYGLLPSLALGIAIGVNRSVLGWKLTLAALAIASAAVIIGIGASEDVSIYLVDEVLGTSQHIEWLSTINASRNFWGAFFWTTVFTGIFAIVDYDKGWRQDDR